MTAVNAEPRRAGGATPGALAGAVALAVAAMWLAAGVGLADAALFGGYLAAFTVAPGVAAWWALNGRISCSLTDLALGWAVGYALELVAFSATAAAGARGLFPLYPPLVIAVAALVLHRRRTRGRRPAPTPAGPAEGRGWMWALAGVLGLLLVCVADGYFAPNPLPSSIGSAVSYLPDYVWQISVAAEARHHWPLQVPNVAGERLEYHWFAFAHMAAVNQVTGIDLATVVLRLAPVAFVVESALLLVALGRRLAGTAWAGVVAVVLAFLVGPFVPWPRPPSEFFTHIYESASFGYGLLFFLALAVIALDQLRATRVTTAGTAAFVLLAAVAAGAKSSILPVVAGGLALLVVAAARRERGRPWTQRTATRSTAVLAAIAVAAFVCARIVLYPHASAELELRPLHDVGDVYPAALADTGAGSHGVLHAAILALVAIPVYLRLLMPLVPGIWLALRQPEARRDVGTWWALALIAVALAIFAIFWQRSSSQAYFLYYGYVAAAAVSAWGLTALWQRRFGDVRMTPLTMTAGAALLLTPWLVSGPAGSRGSDEPPARLYQRLEGAATWSTENSNLTPELYRGFRWIAAHTPEDAVLATNNRWMDAGLADARYFYVSAFAERRTVLEGYYGVTSGAYEFASQAQLLQDPRAGTYGDRAAAIQAIFQAGDRRALAEARRRWAVTHLVLDRVHQGVADPARVAALGRVVHRTPSLLVVDVRR